MQNRFNSVFNIGFPERHGAGGNSLLRYTATDEGFGIWLFAFRAHHFYNLFVTGEFNVTAKQNISNPYQRVEPIYAQQRKTERLPQVVAPLQMRFFVRKDIRHICFFHRRRQKNMRLKNAENKRCGDAVTKVNVFCVFYAFVCLSAKLHEAHNRIDCHCQNTEKPNCRKQRCNVQTCVCRHSNPFKIAVSKLGVYTCIHTCKPCLHRKGRLAEYLVGNRLRTRNQAERAF